MANLGNSSSVQEMIEEAVSRGIERGVRKQPVPQDQVTVLWYK